ncbi:MAG: amino acid permease [Planctomycetota bacterium]|jgi:amino acid transporter/mannitol/fructose-specific phosphotransferase system IIA component (Ntr-type)|nr:amino acid permease [Planctomycetota bacterium]MDP7131169.1 amino acid permease [Planctomycetota bacterium]MDP7251464.1 amino acid permease [Planctomycetota bacterium]
MATQKTPMKKGLTLFSVYALATGATLSSGFFLLPGVAYGQAGPAVVLCYLLAAVPLIPATLCSVELGTAMPRAGGAYYFLDRSMGPFIGTIGGMGTWLALLLKTAFALVGMGVYVELLVQAVAPSISVPIVPAAAGFAVLFAMLNLMGAEKTGSFQIFLVGGLLTILAWFIGKGFFNLNMGHFGGFLDAGANSIVSTAGLVYISYVGVTNVASVSEEVKDPERNLPIGVFLAVLTAIIIYGVGTFVMVGAVDISQLHSQAQSGGAEGALANKQILRIVSTCAQAMAGKTGAILMSIGAICAFFAVANAGILSSSRYPLAMSRDHLLPATFRSLNTKGMPSNGIYLSLGIVLLILFFLDPMKIAKLASAFQLLLFGFLCLAVVVMRESGLESYDPGYRAPFYPWLQVIGIIAPCYLILNMGALPILFSTGLIAFGAFWYFYYGKSRVERHGAIYHVFERLGHKRHEGLDRELRGIMKEKGLRSEDPYDEVVMQAGVLDITEPRTFEEITGEASTALAEMLDLDRDKLANGFLEGTGVGSTPVSGGAALPHVRVHDLESSGMVVVRTKESVKIEVSDSLHMEHATEDPIHAIFFLVSPEADPARHLRILAQLARHIDSDNFIEQWEHATDEQEIREILLRDERFVHIEISKNGSSSYFLGERLRELQLPPGCLIAVVRRDEMTFVPDGNTVFKEDDRLTVIGEPKAIQELYADYT